MAKNCKLKMLFIILLLTMLLFSGAFASLVSIVNAAEPTVQDKTLEILNEVVGINTEEYATVRSSQLDNSYRNLPQKEVDISLVSEQKVFGHISGSNGWLFYCKFSLISAQVDLA